MADPTPFGDLVRRLRVERGWSQPRLAKIADVSVGYIGGIESGLRGKNPSRDVVLKIARGLGVPPYELLEAAGRLEAGDDPNGRAHRATFAQFVRGDPDLRDDEREMLIRLYRSYTGARSPKAPR